MIMKPIDRSSVNQEQYSAPEFSKSGFDLSHRRWSSYILGRLHVSGFQECMPNDKISGKNDGDFYFNRIVTPVVSDVEVGQYNLYIPYRAIDTSFVEAFTPNKNNGMSASWSAPSFSIKRSFEVIMSAIAGGVLPENIDTDPWIVTFMTFMNGLWNDHYATVSALIANDFSGYTLDEVLYSGFGLNKGLLQQVYESYTTGYVHTQMAKVYADDICKDLIEFIQSRLGTHENPISSSMPLDEFMYNFFDTILTPIIGRYSYLCELRYNYLRPKDIYSLAYNPDHLALGLNFTAFCNNFDDTPQNEYAIRAMYAIWYEHFRNVDLEPVSADLPNWRKFNSSSVFSTVVSAPFKFFVYRCRNWYKDPINTAQIDDLSRHVFAPVYNNALDNISGHHSLISNNYTSIGTDPSNVFDGGSKPSLYILSWIDQLSGTQNSLECPVPANINDVLSASDLSSSEVYGLDLNSLRQSQMLERYLKRNYLFGDEYQDRMLAHYNSRVSDLRINRPEILSRSLNSMKMSQEVASVSTPQTNVGDRTATATISSSGDQYTTYCEEFGILINLITFMPFGSYDGICGQRLLSKVIDYPLPEFASNNEEFGRIREIADSALQPYGFDRFQDFMFGRYPAYHQWRGRVDEVGGMFLNELQNCTFRRFWGLTDVDGTPKLNYQFLHCRPNLQMFANTVRYDSQVYGDVYHECYVERVLPTPVEVI